MARHAAQAEHDAMNFLRLKLIMEPAGTGAFRILELFSIAVDFFNFNFSWEQVIKLKIFI